MLSLRLMKFYLCSKEVVMDVLKFFCGLVLFIGVTLSGLYVYMQSQTATIVYACSEVTDKDPADVQRICKYAMKWK